MTSTWTRGFQDCHSSFRQHTAFVRCCELRSLLVAFVSTRLLSDAVNFVASSSLRQLTVFVQCCECRSRVFAIPINVTKARMININAWFPSPRLRSSACSLCPGCVNLHAVSSPLSLSHGTTQAKGSETKRGFQYLHRRLHQLAVRGRAVNTDTVSPSHYRTARHSTGRRGAVQKRGSSTSIEVGQRAEFHTFTPRRRHQYCHKRG